MRTATVILHDVYNSEKYSYADYFTEPCIVDAINEARKEAIEECAKRASVQINNIPGRLTLSPPSVNQESILSLIAELK